MNLLLLYLEFFKVGIFAVGGGLATLPFLFLMASGRFTFITRTGWLSTEQVGNFLAIAQCSPGAVGVNMAVQTGFSYGGAAGGIVAALGLVSPAVVVISVIAGALAPLRENNITVRVFSGLRPAAAGLLAAAGWGVLRLALYNADTSVWYGIIRPREAVVFAVLFLAVVKWKKYPVVYVAMGAAAGIVLGL